MERFAAGLDEDSRDREAASIMEREQNITSYQVEPEMEKVMTDFYLKPYTNILEDPLRTGAKKALLTPLNYYDNDDGFWSEYIAHKEQRWGANPLIVHRPYIRH